MKSLHRLFYVLLTGNAPDYCTQIFRDPDADINHKAWVYYKAARQRDGSYDIYKQTRSSDTVRKFEDHGVEIISFDGGKTPIKQGLDEHGAKEFLNQMETELLAQNENHEHDIGRQFIEALAVCHGPHYKWMPTRTDPKQAQPNTTLERTL